MKVLEGRWDGAAGANAAHSADPDQGWGAVRGRRGAIGLQDVQSRSVTKCGRILRRRLMPKFSHMTRGDVIHRQRHLLSGCGSEKKSSQTLGNIIKYHITVKKKPFPLFPQPQKGSSTPRGAPCGRTSGLSGLWEPCF